MLGIFRTIIDILLPVNCLICGRPATVCDCLCNECYSRFAEEAETECPICGKHALDCACGSDFSSVTQTEICGRYSASLTFYKNADSFGVSDRVTEKLIFELKDHSNCVDFFASRLADMIKSFPDGTFKPKEWRITYPPRSAKKYRRLGFDQCEEVGEALSAKTGIPLVRVFTRDYTAREQKKLSGSERIENASDTLTVNREDVEAGRKYIILDDIITSGATMMICARHLYFCGAAEVFPISIARTMPRKQRTD